MKGIISVIIPVYNVRPYLAEAVESVLQQDYQQLQIILIDDGSTDGSGEFCDRYAREDKRVIVLHQKNSGAASAKNAGLRIASGDYLTFVDSDDFLEKDAYSYMVNKLENLNADVIQCSFREIYKNDKKDKVILEKEEAFDVVSYLRRYTSDWTCGLLWDKLYRRELFDNIYFEEGHIVDDEFFTYQGIMNAKKIIHESKIVYNYRKRKSSVTAKKEYQERTVLDKLDYLKQRRIRIDERFPILKPDFDNHFLNMLLWLSVDPNASKQSLEVTKEYLKTYFAENSVCKMTLGKRIKLFDLQITSIQRLLKRKRRAKEIELSEYFD